METKSFWDYILHVFGYEPKEEQLEAIESYYLYGRDTVFVAPTGFEKSLLYKAAPCLFDTDSSAATLVYILIKLILASTQINLELILYLISISKLSDGYKTDLPTKVLVILWAIVPTTDFWCDKQII